MKALMTRVGTYLTGDAIADAVLSYSLELARAQQIDAVDVPFRAEDGEIVRVQLRVGWMVDIDAVSHDGHHTELTDDAITDELSARERALRPHGDTPLVAADLVSLDDLRDYW